VKFRRLELIDFLSHEQTTLPLDMGGLVLIVGHNKDDPSASSNGAGKTVLLESVAYALFGTTNRPISVDRVKRSGSKRCEVTLECEVDGKSLVVTRSRDSSTHLRVVFDGQEIEGANIREVQKRLEGLIGCDFETFKNSVMFPQGEVRFFTSLTDTQKKEVLERILPLTPFSKAYQRVREKVAEKKRNIQDIDVVLGTIRNSLNEISLKMKKTRDELRSRSQSDKQSRLKKRIEELTSSLPSTEHLERKLQNLRSRLRGVRQRNSKFETIRMNLDSRILGTENKIADLRGRLREMNSLRYAECPTCGQLVTAEAADLAVLKLQQNIDQETEVLKDLRKKLSTVPDLRDEIRSIENEIDKVTREIGERSSENRRITARIEELKTQLESLKAPERNLKATLTALREQKKSLKERLESEERKRQTLERELEYLNFWVDGFSPKGLRGMVLRGCLDSLNDLANDYLQVLADGRIQVKFSPKTVLSSGAERECISTTVTCAGGEIGSVSGGERRKIDLAVLLALRHIVSSRSRERFNVLFADEVFDALDSSGIERALQLLERECEDGSTVFVITHDEVLSEFFDTVIRVEKEGGISRVILPSKLRI